MKATFIPARGMCSRFALLLSVANKQIVQVSMKAPVESCDHLATNSAKPDVKLTSDVQIITLFIKS
jgi:hypothetical protein